jgi:hypothetical protein
MAIGDPYATVAQLRARLDRPDDGSFYRVLDAASRAVETFTGRQFNQVDAPSPRRFRAQDRERVAVDDFFTLTDLVVDVNGALWDVGDHVDPRRGGGWSGEIQWPFSDLFAVRRSWPLSRRHLITVTAWWGWDDVPPGIVEATLDVAEVMSLSITGGQSGAVRSETIGGYSVSYAMPQMGTGNTNVPPEFAKAIGYRRKRFGVA